ncbi:MAG: FAD-dependent oxidoreductase [Acidimicrobiales bacterium]
MLSSVTVELGYDRGSVPHPLDGTGIVVAEGLQEHGMRACAFTSAKFAGRAPDTSAAIRVFFRPDPDDLGGLDDAGWQARGEAALSRLLGITDAPRRTWITRWADALPVFNETFRSDVAALEETLSASHIALAGAAFHGPGIDAAIRSGEQAAARWA